MKRGWFRRNIWGLVLVGPLAAGLFATNVSTAYQRNYSGQAKEPVPVDGTGLAVLDDYRVRVMEFAPVDNELEIDKLVGFGQDAPPGNVRIWRAMVSIDAPRDDNSTINLCDSWLEDEAGRRYAKNPSELRGVPHVFGACSPDIEDQPSPYTTTLIYLLPAEARPASVVLTWVDRLPRYIRLPVVP
jgi:hypothetical protein